MHKAGALAARILDEIADHVFVGQTTGAIDKIFFWDPALAGQAMMKIAQMLVNGEELSSGMDLGLEGYESVQQSPDVPTTWYGSAWVIVDKDNAADYPF